MKDTSKPTVVAKTLNFEGYPLFKPNLTPRNMIELGVFGGAYFRDIHSAVTGEDYTRQWEEFPWAVQMVKENPDNLKLLASPVAKGELNYCGVIAGQSLQEWEASGWIDKLDPYGWFQWYCRFYEGRRNEEEDKRQIRRWVNYAGVKGGRWRTRMINLLKGAGLAYDDTSISPAIRQGLLQWAYMLVPSDVPKK
jgi:hypothetical protein